VLCLSKFRYLEISKTEVYPKLYCTEQERRQVKKNLFDILKAHIHEHQIQMLHSALQLPAAQSFVSEKSKEHNL
jgi:uncharacterized protein with von Willebrand factor type A (vWA) domain